MRHVLALSALLLLLGAGAWGTKKHLEWQPCSRPQDHCQCATKADGTLTIFCEGATLPTQFIFDAQGTFGEQAEGAVSLACYRDLQEAVRLALKPSQAIECPEDHYQFSVGLSEAGRLLFEAEKLQCHAKRIQAREADMQRLQAIAARCAPEKTTP